MEKFISVLKNIRNTDSNQIKQLDLDELLEFMLTNIGHPDSTIRDTYIYSGFSYLILHNYFSTSQLLAITTRCMDDEHLFFKINEHEKSDAVLTRSFSALVMALILGKDLEQRFLPEQLALQALKRCIDYLEFEFDYRGYVEHKGWAHSVAHGSDLLSDAVLHPFFNKVSTVEVILKRLQKCLQTDYAYIDEEDERMMPIMDALHEKGLSDEALSTWLLELHHYKHDDGLTHYRIHWNIKKFMLTLYTHLYHEKIFPNSLKLVTEKYVARDTLPI